MKKTIVLFLSALCILGATVISAPKASTSGQVLAEVLLVRPNSPLNFGAVSVDFSGASAPVDVSYAICLYGGKYYSSPIKKKGNKFVVLKSSYSNSWMVSSGKGVYSATAAGAYITSDDSKAQMKKETYT